MFSTGCRDTRSAQLQVTMDVKKAENCWILYAFRRSNWFRRPGLYAVHVDVPCLREHTHFRIEVPVCVIWIRITSDLNHLREGVRRCQPFCPTGPGFLSEMTTFTSATNHPERSESNSRPKTFCSMNSRRGATSSPMWTRGVVQEITCAKPRAGAQPLCLVDSRFMSQDSTFMSPTN